jgi:hypothetical protein
MKDGLDKDRTFSKTSLIKGWVYVMEDLIKDRTFNKHRLIKGSMYVNLHAQRKLFNAIST